MRKTIVGKRAAVLLCLLLMPLAAACGDDEVIGPREPEDVEFDPSLGVNLNTMTKVEDGLYYKTIQTGDEEGLSAGAGTLATLDVTAWLPDGTQVFGPVEIEIESINEGEPFEGLSRGLREMFIGEVRQVVIASRLAWGQAGAEGIPPHSVIVMEAELLELTLPH